jgi:hypothetical protein
VRSFVRSQDRVRKSGEGEVVRYMKFGRDKVGTSTTEILYMKVIVSEAFQFSHACSLLHSSVSFM